MHKNTCRYFIYCDIINIFGTLCAVKQKKKVIWAKEIWAQYTDNNNIREKGVTS